MRLEHRLAEHEKSPRDPTSTYDWSGGHSDQREPSYQSKGIDGCEELYVEVFANQAQTVQIKWKQRTMTKEHPDK